MAFESNVDVCRARHESGARKALGEGVLQQVEQTDLMSYGLIPEFVGRFPIITALNVGLLNFGTQNCIEAKTVEQRS